MPYPKQGKRKVPAPHQGQSWGTFRRMGLKTSLPQIIRERFVERHSPPFLPLRDPAGKDGAGHNGYFACCPVCLFQMVMSLRWGVEKGRIESCQRSSMFSSLESKRSSLCSLGEESLSISCHSPLNSF